MCQVEWFTQVIPYLPESAIKVLAVLIEPSVGVPPSRQGVAPDGSPVRTSHLSLKALLRETRLSRRSIQAGIACLRKIGLVSVHEPDKRLDPHAPRAYSVPLFLPDEFRSELRLKAEVHILHPPPVRGAYFAPPQTSVSPKQTRGAESSTLVGQLEGQSRGAKFAPLDSASPLTTPYGGGVGGIYTKSLSKNLDLDIVHQHQYHAGKGVGKPEDQSRGAKIAPPQMSLPPKQTRSAESMLNSAPLAGKNSEGQKVFPEPEEVWDSVLLLLKEEVNKANYEMWLKDTTGFSYDGRIFEVAAPNMFTAEWLQKRMLSICQRCLHATLGKVVELKFRLPGEPAKIDVVSRLEQIGFTNARRFVNEHPEDKILAALDHLERADNIINPAGFVRHLLDDDKEKVIEREVDNLCSR